MIGLSQNSIFFKLTEILMRKIFAFVLISFITIATAQSAEATPYSKINVVAQS